MAKAKNFAESTTERKIRIAKEKHARFVKLAVPRVSRAIKAIRNVARLSNRGSYSFDSAEVQKIFTAMSAEMQKAADGFNRTETDKADVGFTL